MKELIFINVNYVGNAGDFWSSPLKYYEFENFEIKHIHFMDVWHFLRGKSNYEHANVRNKIVIIGGGGLLTTKDNFIQKTTEFLVNNNKVIFWGVGSNTFENPTYEILKHENVILSGTRDINYDLNCNYVPCVSCKNNLFDNVYFENDSIGLLEHPSLPIEIDGFDKITNQYSIEEILKFIGSKSIIISSTFHGVYWSQLLNKKVLYYSFEGKINSKIYNMKNRVIICNKDNFSKKVEKLSSTHGMLEESRFINDEFYNNVLKVLENN